MKKVIMYEDADGHLSKTKSEALNYADRKYGELLTNITHKILRIEQNKYTGITDFIDQNLTEFEKLIQLKNNMSLISDIDIDDE